MMPEIVSTVAIGLVAAGLVARHRPKVHVPLMVSAFAVDLGLVLYLELARGAIETATTRPSTVLVVHLVFSVTVLALYVVQLVLGIRLLRGRTSARSWHRRGAALFIVCRLGSYATSFLV